MERDLSLTVIFSSRMRDHRAGHEVAHGHEGGGGGGDARARRAGNGALDHAGARAPRRVWARRRGRRGGQAGGIAGDVRRCVRARPPGACRRAVGR